MAVKITRNPIENPTIPLNVEQMQLAQAITSYIMSQFYMDFANNMQVIPDYQQDVQIKATLASLTVRGKNDWICKVEQIATQNRMGDIELQFPMKWNNHLPSQLRGFQNARFAAEDITITIGRVRQAREKFTYVLTLDRGFLNAVDATIERDIRACLDAVVNTPSQYCLRFYDYKCRIWQQLNFSDRPQPVRRDDLPRVSHFWQTFSDTRSMYEVPTEANSDERIFLISYLSDVPDVPARLVPQPPDNLTLTVVPSVFGFAPESWHPDRPPTWTQQEKILMRYILVQYNPNYQEWAFLYRCRSSTFTNTNRPFPLYPETRIYLSYPKRPQQTVQQQINDFNQSQTNFTLLMEENAPNIDASQCLVTPFLLWECFPKDENPYKWLATNRDTNQIVRLTLTKRTNYDRDDYCQLDKRHGLHICPSPPTVQLKAIKIKTDNNPQSFCKNGCYEFSTTDDISSPEYKEVVLEFEVTNAPALLSSLSWFKLDEIPYIGICERNGEIVNTREAFQITLQIPLQRLAGKHSLQYTIFSHVLDVPSLQVLPLGKRTIDIRFSSQIYFDTFFRTGSKNLSKYFDNQLNPLDLPAGERHRVHCSFETHTKPGGEEDKITQRSYLQGRVTDPFMLGAEPAIPLPRSRNNVYTIHYPAVVVYGELLPETSSDFLIFTGWFDENQGWTNCIVFYGQWQENGDLSKHLFCFRADANNGRQISELPADIIKDIILKELNFSQRPCYSLFLKDSPQVWEPTSIQSVLGTTEKPGSSLFSVGDFKEPAKLIGRLRDAASRNDPVSLLLQSMLNIDCQQRIGKYKDGEPLSQEFLVTLVSELNRLLAMPLYRQEIFANVKLSEGTQRQIASKDPKDFKGEELLRLNRLLLEDAYPYEIAKSQKPQGCEIDSERLQASSDKAFSRILAQPDTLQNRDSVLNTDYTKHSFKLINHAFWDIDERLLELQGAQYSYWIFRTNDETETFLKDE